ncbi:MAG: hypothetical protein WAN47_11400 [Nitrosotalea sp.]
MNTSIQSMFTGAKLYAIIAVVCVASVVGIALGLESSVHFAKPGYIPPGVTAPAKGPCLSFEYNCHDTVKHPSSYYDSGAYLDQPAP